MFVSSGWVCEQGAPPTSTGNRTSLSSERQTATSRIDMPNDFFSWSRSFWFAGLVALLAGVPAARAAKPAAAKLGTVRQQVHRAKAELQKQVTLGDYHASAYHPTAIVERIHALESADAWAELCAAFGWSEADVLAMSRVRRDAYLALLRGRE